MCCHVTQTKHVYAYFCGVKYSMLRCQRNLKPNDKMKKKFSDTIMTNRGVGDQRIRNMESNDQRIAKAIDKIQEEMQEARGIEFVAQLPETPNPKTLYFITEADS